MHDRTCMQYAVPPGDGRDARQIKSSILCLRPHRQQVTRLHHVGAAGCAAGRQLRDRLVHQQVSRSQVNQVLGCGAQLLGVTSLIGVVKRHGASGAGLAGWECEALNLIATCAPRSRTRTLIRKANYVGERSCSNKGVDALGAYAAHQEKQEQVQAGREGGGKGQCLARGRPGLGPFGTL